MVGLDQVNHLRQHFFGSSSIFQSVFSHLVCFRDIYHDISIGFMSRLTVKLHGMCTSNIPKKKCTVPLKAWAIHLSSHDDPVTPVGQNLELVKSNRNPPTLREDVLGRLSALHILLRFCFEQLLGNYLRNQVPHWMKALWNNLQRHSKNIYNKWYQES